MRIIVDMQGAQSASAHRGIGRYTRSLIRSLLRIASPAHEFILVFNGQLQGGLHYATHALRDIIAPSQCRVWYAPIPLNAAHQSSYDNRQIALRIYSQCILSLEPDAILLTSLFEGYVDNAFVELDDDVLRRVPVSAILYDLIPFRYSKEFLADRSYREFYLGKLALLQRLHQLLCISEYSLSDYRLLSRGRSPVQRLHFVGAASDLEVFADDLSSSAAESLATLGQFLLFVGSCDLHKNLDGLLRACALLPGSLNSVLNIVIAGVGHSAHEVKRKAQSLGLNPDLIHVKADCTDSDIGQLYSACHLFVAPSLMEGFGLPALEAMQKGAICIGSNTSSLPDVIGVKDALFDPNNYADMASLIERAWLDYDFRADLYLRQQAHASSFSWPGVAQCVLDRLIELTSDLRPASIAQEEVNYGPIAVADRVRPYIKALQLDAGLIARYIVHTFPQLPRRRRLLVDISEFTTKDSATGIQRVVRSVLAALPGILPSDWQIVPVYGTVSTPGYFTEAKVSQHIIPSLPSDQQADSPALMHARDILLVLDLQHSVALAQRDVLRSMRSRGISVYFVVYDILPIQYPAFFQNGVVLSGLHEAWLNLVAEMDGYFAISRAVRDQVSVWMSERGLPAHPSYRHGFFHLGADLCASLPSRGLPQDCGSLLALLRARPSFLQVSTLEPRKGPAQLLSAFEILWDMDVDVNLVLVGKQGWLVDDLVAKIRSHPELGARLFWLEGITDEMLESVYEVCTCGVMASYGEGFGLPLVEAAQKGLPLIARDIPVFREVAGEGAFFFDASTPEGLASAIAEWLHLYSNGEHPDSSVVDCLSWSESARQLFERILDAEQRLAFGSAPAL